MSKEKESLIKLFIIIITLGFTILNMKADNVSAFIILILVFLLNMQLRRILLKGRVFLVSLIAELIIINYLYQSFEGLIYVLLFETLLDGLLNSIEYKSGIMAVIGVNLFFLLVQAPSEHLLLGSLVYLLIAIFSNHITAQRESISELEYLYDDVRRYSYDLENAKKKLEIYSKKIEQMAQLEERNRISEEIHDTIGHRLAGLLLQMEAGVRLLGANKEKGTELLMTSVDNLRESIDVMRDTVRDIKPKEYKNFIKAIKDMIDKVKKSTNYNIEFVVEGSPLKLSPLVETALFNNIQEAITNSLKHGNGDTISMVLMYNTNEIFLKISDNGKGCEDIKKGMGITAMEERINLAGGSLNYYSNNGFVLETIVPIK